VLEKERAAVKIPEAIKRLFEKDEVYTFVSHDQVEPTIVVYEPDCKVDQIHSGGGYLLIPHPIARRLPEPHGTITHANGNVPCWKLGDLTGN
jgi:hypothetical protein